MDQRGANILASIVDYGVVAAQGGGFAAIIALTQLFNRMLDKRNGNGKPAPPDPAYTAELADLRVQLAKIETKIDQLIAALG